MICCRHLAALLIDFVANELPPDQVALVEEHLRECPPCVAYLESYRVTIAIGRKLPCRPMPPALEQRLRAALRSIHAGAQSDPSVR